MASYQQEAFLVLQTAWSNRSPDPSLAIENAAQTLASSTAESRDPTPSACIWSTILAIHQLATQQPTAIDFLLHIYQKTCTLYPTSVTNEYGSGEKAGLQQLRWWLIDEANIFDTVTFPNDIGEPAPGNKSSLRFSEEDVCERTPAVLQRITEWRERRNKLVICMAIMSRCFALDIVRESEGRHAAKSISVAFQRHNRWTEADFVSNCISLRGCAKSLLDTVEGGSRLAKEWESNLKAFLWAESDQGGQNFLLQHHASVSTMGNPHLINLVVGLIHSV